MTLLEELAARRRFGMRPGLDAIRAVCASLGDPQKAFKAIHVAGTNGKGAVCAILDAALRAMPGTRVGRYTSPHLVRINERFFLEGSPVDDRTLELISSRIDSTIRRFDDSTISNLTFFEALTAIAFLIYAEANVDYAVLECGLGGRLDATNVCCPELCVITKIGLDHCDWLGDTVEKIAAEKAGIVKPGVPVVLGRNEPSVRAVVEARARELGAPFFYAPELASEDEVPADFSLVGAFNRENAVTAFAALKILNGSRMVTPAQVDAFARVVWPGRFQRVGDTLVDGAHNPPAARALRKALEAEDVRQKTLDLICGFCGDKDAEEVLRILSPLVRRGYAVRTNNPRSLSAEETAAKMRAVGMDAVACASLADALALAERPNACGRLGIRTLVCGSLFLSGEALVALGAFPWPSGRFDPSERLSRNHSREVLV